MHFTYRGKKVGLILAITTMPITLKSIFFTVDICPSWFDRFALVCIFFANMCKTGLLKIHENLIKSGNKNKSGKKLLLNNIKGRRVT